MPVCKVLMSVVGSNSEVGTRNRDVRFTPDTGLSIAGGALPKRANSGHIRTIVKGRQCRTPRGRVDVEGFLPELDGLGYDYEVPREDNE